MDLSDYRVLVTDNDAESASRVLGALNARGMSAERVAHPPRIENILSREEIITLVIITGGIHERSIIRFLEGLKHAPASLGVICLLESTEPEKISFFDRLGVDEIFEKPVEGEEIAQAVSRLLERKRLISSIGLIGKTTKMREVVERVAQYSQVNSTVLIYGDSGTGKELVAQAIHRLSSRRHKTFIAVNCGAIAEGVLESELFGHEKGSFTGATSLRKGHFEIADGGTVFLDEVGEMPLSVQVKLLRVLEEREFMRVGGSQKIKVDVRMLAATNKDLEFEVEIGRFRRDLYYRLKVLSIYIPSLQERREDIPLLLNFFIEQFCRENNKTFVGIDDDAVEILKNYDWPGNVRELRNLAESMVVLSLGSRIRAKDIPDQIFRRGSPERLLPVPFPPVEKEDRKAQQALELHLLYQAVLNLQKEMSEIKRLLSGYVVPENRHAGVDTAHRDSGTPYAEEARTGDRIEEKDISRFGSVQFEESEEISGKAQNLQEIERKAIVRTLASTGGNRRKAAKILGIGERTLYRKIKEYNLK
ncbi:MAG TPA: sigma-54 dependent transcriptional regulator [archaeon]|nr:sigma-54 dependent transcriptional regulator [archaeon]